MPMREAVIAIKGRTAYDGAGVKLQRIFGHEETSLFDPFLLLDEFGSKNPADYLPGFPMHPHRGIETVTYLIDGSVRHSDSTGGGGVIGPGDLQWMSAGSGIIHEEMPLESPNGVRGLQLWVNMPRKLKMSPPAYHGATAAEVPIVPTGTGPVRVLAGEWGGGHGPVIDVLRNPVYLDVTLNPASAITLDVPNGRTAFIYILSGAVATGSKEHRPAPAGYDAGTCVLLGDGDEARMESGDNGARFVIVHAVPLHEPIAWGGPIVMNTRDELEQAFRELDEGTFIRP